MERRLKRIEILVILTLIIATLSVVMQIIPDYAPTLQTETKSEVKEIPNDVSIDSFTSIIDTIRLDYNDSDWENIYHFFGNYAKAQFRVNDIEQEFVKIKPATGNILSIAYSHYEYLGYDKNADWYKFYYKCMFDNGKGTIKLSTRTVNNKTEIIGLSVDLDGF